MKRMIVVFLSVFGVLPIFVHAVQASGDAWKAEPEFLPIQQGAIGDTTVLSIVDCPVSEQARVKNIVLHCQVIASHLAPFCEEWLRVAWTSDGEEPPAFLEVRTKTIDTLKLLVGEDVLPDATVSWVELRLHEVRDTQIRYLLGGEFDRNGNYVHYGSDAESQDFYLPHQLARSPSHYRCWRDPGKLTVEVPVFRTGTYVGDLSITFRVELLLRYR